MMNSASDNVAPLQQIEPMNAVDNILEVLPEVKMSPSNNDVNTPPQTIKTALDKPIRPLTAYHLYFQLEREFIIQSTVSDDYNIEKVDIRPIGLEIDPEMPLRYHYIHLSPDWYASGKEKRGSSDQKRKHRKTHGKIAFLDLSRLVASRWATLEETDPETKFYCAKVAKRELDSYKLQVKKYKASLSGVSSESVTSSFSSTGTSSSAFSLSPSSIHLSISAECPRNLENQASIDRGNSDSMDGKCSTGSLKGSTNSANDIQVYPGFDPEWMDRETNAPVQHIDWATSTIPGETGTSASMNSMSSSTNNPTNFQFEPIHLSEWCPAPLSKWMGEQDHASKPAELARKSISGAIDNANASSRSSSRVQAASLSSSTSSRKISDEFSFHPVPCDAEDAFLKKYRKLARRTSLFSIHPLHHRCVPMSQSISADTTNSDNAGSNSSEYESKSYPTNPPGEYDSIQTRLRNELDERLARVYIGRCVKGRAVKTSQEQSNHEWHKESTSIGAPGKRKSPILSETIVAPSHLDNSLTLVDFAPNDASMLMDVLSDHNNSGHMESSRF
ncbi:hypothetical protein HJC23_006513 [Cyclotella cryptica]|uniref:HMG box domain-containing protein n=1 Tax=Cyclotella cryptica TaxID=29204 RepID=A0ABD3PP48_9STRA|eukprot:CCRYP_013005-RA/>CCRYP_013005-RA protein AED:0.00 eAED:0.00 QI:102/-1/1/1/-1/1/1/496/558